MAYMVKCCLQKAKGNKIQGLTNTHIVLKPSIGISRPQVVLHQGYSQPQNAVLLVQSRGSLLFILGNRRNKGVLNINLSYRAVPLQPGAFNSIVLLK
jgi:hypothetical protein